MKAYEIRIDENRVIMARRHLGGVQYQISNGGAVTRIALTYEAVGAMYKLAEKLAADATTKTTKRKAEKAGKGSKA